MNIKKIQALNAEIENFRSCYKGNELWGDREGEITPEKLIEYLIEHPEFQAIADRINNINRELP